MTKKTSSLFIGTCGYSYTEWIEAGFYPQATQSGKMLPLYAAEFPITELNFTWYQMPRPEAIERMRQNVPESFLFTAKLTRTMTHEVEQNLWQKQVEKYRNGIVPLIQSRQLLAILIQLPPDFARTQNNRRYLAGLLDLLEGLPLAIEFRHASWATDRVFKELEKRQVILVTVDEPKLPGLFPALDVVTHPDFFYIRFHGRNSKGWRSGTMQKKFDYSYTEEELQQWIEQKIMPMTEKSKTGLIFFNNHVAGQAPQNAKTLISLLRREGFRVNEEAPQHLTPDI